MASIQDVAKLAGVSTATVSRVLSGYAHVTPDTRARVTKAVDSLGYAPNALARNLRTLKTSRLILTVPDITNIFFSSIIRGAEEAASAAGYTVLLSDAGSGPDSGDACAGLLRRREADGLICLGHRLPDALAPLADTPGAPIVQGCECDEAHPLSVVRIDNARAASEVMDYLYSLGHRRIAVIGGHVSSQVSRDRFTGVAASAARHDAQADLTCLNGDYSMDCGAEATARLIAQTPRPTAIFCFGDDMAMGALHALRQAGLSCPQDISVVGFDDIGAARFTAPPLTTVRQPMRAIGQRCVAALLAILNGQRSEPVVETLPHELVIRDSTATV
ncbi:MAG: LacI family DNA-binding transcriptional regulator [Asticcacaulis sp.]|uniref:LacI family DNA-binding transcriptional regulator n=1 Tax=Asticcacaulis sp. TaxID=1872648 RepID=UPI003F7BFA6F